MDALRVIQRGDLTPGQMRGPAHGEVGQFQFQPKTYYEYAVDFDGDGHRDLVSSAPDSLASAANYISSKGWQANQPWLEEVRVPANLPWDQADVTIKKPRPFWARHGVTYGTARPCRPTTSRVAAAADGAQRPGVPRLPQFRRLSRVEQVARLLDDRGLLRHAARRGAAAQPRQPSRSRRRRPRSCRRCLPAGLRRGQDRRRDRRFHPRCDPPNADQIRASRRRLSQPRAARSAPARRLTANLMSARVPARFARATR